MIKLIDVAVLNDIKMTIKNMSVEQLSNGSYCISFTVYINGKGLWILKREWISMDGEVEGNVLKVNIKKVD